MKVRSVELCVNPKPKLLKIELHAEYSVVLVVMFEREFNMNPSSIYIQLVTSSLD